MNSQSVKSIIINGKKIHWETFSGIAIGVQKYTKTHVSGGYKDTPVSSSIETIIEFSILQDNGNETEIVLREEEIKVRNGQRVSVVQGHTRSIHSEMIFINHDSDKQHWICTPDSFFEHLGIFMILTAEFAVLCMVILVIISLYILFTASISSLVVIGYIGGIALIVFYQIQKHRVKMAWDTIEPQIVEIAKQLKIKQNKIC